MERREFFRGLIAGGAVVAQPTRAGKYYPHADELMYCGPMSIPAHIAEIVRESPNIAMSGRRPQIRPDGRRRINSGHPIMRYRDEFAVWKFRVRIPDSRHMVGDIRRAPDGHLTVCCWQAARPGEYRTPDSLLANNPARIDAERLPRPLSLPILPPLSCWEEIGLRGTDISASPDGKKDE